DPAEPVEPVVERGQAASQEEPQHAQETAAAQPVEPPATPKRPSRPAPKAYLNITSPMKLKVTVDSRYVGETPINKLPVEPGTHRVSARSPTQGFTLSHKIRVSAGRTEDLDLRPRKGNLAINATPWAWVSVGKEAP